MKWIALTLALAACGGVELEETEEISAIEVETAGCRGRAFGYCLRCMGLNCWFEQCAPTAEHFWMGQQNDDRARCRTLVSNWAKPKACTGEPILAYSWWFRTTSGAHETSGLMGCSQ